MQVVGMIWYLGVCIGHTALLTLSINWWYSFALPSRFFATRPQVSRPASSPKRSNAQSKTYQQH